MAGVKKGASEEIWTAGLHVHEVQKKGTAPWHVRFNWPCSANPSHLQKGRSRTCTDGRLHGKKSKLNVSKHGTRNNNSSLRNERFQIDACTRYVYMCKKTHEHDCLSSCFSTACAGCTQHCAELTLTLLLLKLVIFKIE